MAGKSATSFVKRQKEMNRNARAKEKRATRQTRRDERAAGIRGESPLDEIMLPLDGASEDTGEEAAAEGVEPAGEAGPEDPPASDPFA